LIVATRAGGVDDVEVLSGSETPAVLPPDQLGPLELARTEGANTL